VPPSGRYHVNPCRSRNISSITNVVCKDGTHNSVAEGYLVSSNAMDQFSISMLKGLGLNLATLPRETLYLLQDGITIELWARESHVIQVLSE